MYATYADTSTIPKWATPTAALPQVLHLKTSLQTGYAPSAVSPKMIFLCKNKMVDDDSCRYTDIHGMLGA